MVKRRKNLTGGLFLFGTLCILLACILFVRNRLEDSSASQSVEKVMEQLHAQLPDSVETPASPIGTVRRSSPTGEAEPEYTAVPDYILSPNMEMPEAEIDGNRYIGYLYFPTLGAELSVMSFWSYSNLKTSPCLYSGSVYNGDAVIAAHNYSSHFGRLFHLDPGDPVYFVDVDGNVFLYEIVIQEVLDPGASEEMVSSGFALSLFTCTYGGASRFTVRCKAP